MKEIRVCWESNRWWDLLRTGKDEAVLSAFASPAYPYSTVKRLFGIPEAEILLMILQFFRIQDINTHNFKFLKKGFREILNPFFFLLQF